MENKENQPIRNNSPLSNNNLNQPSVNSIKNEINQQQNRPTQQPNRPNQTPLRPKPNQQFTRQTQIARPTQSQPSNPQSSRPTQPQPQPPIKPTQPIRPSERVTPTQLGQTNRVNNTPIQQARPPQPEQTNRPVPPQQPNRSVPPQQQPKLEQQTTQKFAQFQSNQQQTRPTQPQQQPIKPTQPIANQTKPQQVNPAKDNQVQNLNKNPTQENEKTNQNNKEQTQSKTNEDDSVPQSNRFNNLGQPVRSSLRSKLNDDSIDLVELEQLNETNLKNFKARTRRNRVIIIVLTILLVITASTIGILLAISKLTNNSFLYIHGRVSATHVVDGYELNRFRTPTEIQGNRLLSIDLDLKIESSGNYNIRFTIDIFQDGEELDNTIIYEYNRTLFYAGNDGYYYSKNPIAGDQTIDLCEGVLIDYRYEHTLNIDNFRMEVHTYIEVAT